MDQKRYLQELTYHLRSLPKPVRDDILEMYRDQFKIAEIDGQSEQDLILTLGRPKAVAEKELAIHADQIDYYPTSAEESEPNQSKSNVFVFILLVMFNLIVVLGPAFGIGLAWLMLWVASVVLMIAPFVVLWQFSLFAVPEIFVAIAAFGLGLLLFVAQYYISKFLFWLVHRYFQVMRRMVRG
ncbi:HAAS signaling domain-containing protein [Amphibacillus sediminis]|uniref:HAAS signaling domain-containing protein n=1 Tax=Amphibacillus sediminis TaxID=360185 RepID=UPI00082A7278|nr:DUF1700 domain-containing protein [Amphibacillus sediminis]